MNYQPHSVVSTFFAAFAYYVIYCFISLSLSLSLFLSLSLSLSALFTLTRIVYSSFYMISFMALYWIVIDCNLISLSRFPLCSPVQVILCAMSLVFLLKCPYSCFSSYFCFMDFVFLFVFVSFLLLVSLAAVTYLFLPFSIYSSNP